MRKRILSISVLAGMFITGIFGNAMQDAEAAGLVLDTAVTGNKVPIGPIVVLLYAGIGGICVVAGNSRDKKEKPGRKNREQLNLEKAVLENPDLDGVESKVAYESETVTGEAEAKQEGKRTSAVKRQEKAEKKAAKKDEKKAAAIKKAEERRAGRKETGKKSKEISTETD